MIGHPDVVMAEIGNVPAARRRDADVVRPRLTARIPWKPDDADTRVVARHVVERVVCQPVPNNQEFKIGEGLFQGRFNRGNDMPASAEGRHNDGENKARAASKTIGDDAGRSFEVPG